MEPILRAEKLTKRFGELTANREIDIEIHAGEIHAIAGENGAGKSTLSNLICGFIHPDHGKILLNGSDIADKSIKERGEAIGLVMQNPNQMISKPMIFDEVALGLRVRGVLYDLAVRCGIGDASGFAERFIYYERQVRADGGQNSDVQ